MRPWWRMACLALAAACGGGAEPRVRVPARVPTARSTPTVSPARSELRAPVLAPSPSAERLPDAHTPVPLDATAIAEIERLIATAIDAHALPGAVVVVGRRAGIVMRETWGRRAVDPVTEPMTSDTVFDLASLTKPVATATSITLLAERGALQLDDRASTYLPELDRPSTRAITLRQLLTHSAGLPPVNPRRDYDQGTDEARTRLLSVEPTLKPGTRHLYGDLGYLWLGEVVHRVAGMPLDAFARKNLFDPLGMRDTRFGVRAQDLTRTAPTERRETTGKWIRGEVHDPRAWRLGGVAGNAGLFSTADDLARFARMLLSGGALDGTRVLAADSVRALTSGERIGDAVRTPGWDMRSAHSRLRGTRLGERAYGHGGFTGVSLWLDPDRDLFVLFLSNRVHPDGTGNVIRLVGAVTDVAARAIDAADAGEKNACASPAGPVQVGIDVWRARGFAPLAGKRIGLLTHDAARAANGQRTVDVLHEASELDLVAVFSPEHGLGAAREGAIADGVDAATGLPIHSLFGATRRPTDAMLAGLDAIVIDVVDVGTRFFTYLSTVTLVLEAAAAHGLPVFVLDRPNPLGGVRVEGPVLDPDIRSFVNYHPLPIRHGLTVGELATLLDAERGIHAKLDVIPMRGWRREMLFEDTRLAWRGPSPNLPSARAALLYPAVGLLEGTNLSVGRGTATPFGVVGAPWIDPRRLAAALDAAGLPGVTFTPTEFEPTARPYARQRCHGVRLDVTKPRSFRPVRTGLEIARALHALHADAFETADLVKLVGSREIVRALLGGTPARELERLAEPRRVRFLEASKPFQRYPDCGAGPEQDG